MRGKTRKAPAFRLIGIYRKGGGILAAGIGDMEHAAGHGFCIPIVVKVEHQRSMHAYRRMQAGWRLPGAKADAGNKFPFYTRGLQRHTTTIASEHETRLRQPSYFHLQTFDRRIDPRGRLYFWSSPVFSCPEPHPDTDVTALAEGYITVTPLQLSRYASR